MASLGLSKLPWHVQLGVFVLIAAAGVGAFYWFYEIPQQQVLAARARELETIRVRNSRGSETARQLPEFRAQVADLERRLEALKPILPEEKDVGDLLRRIQSLATQSNLTILGFRPQPIASREIHAEWPIGLELEGNYHNLGAFLDRVSRFPRIINVGNLVISAKSEATSNSSILVSCTATTFVLVDQSSAPPPDQAGKKRAPAKKAPARKTE
ncbi:MAG: type 4a pilus biogenesis protein PilO [Acidobacteriota bacterium]|nr:type 4a pilus biogenesis protein PilO [Acidobacteriota bacterium]